MRFRLLNEGRRPAWWIAALGLAASLALSGCATSPADAPFPLAASFAIQGIDVSKYQGDVDWQAVSSSGVRFAWIKATEGGDYLDERFRQNWDASRNAGVIRGAYHFVYWCRPAAQQAAWFVANVPNDPFALPPVLDVEWNPTSKTCPRKLPKEQALAMMRTILEAMERAYGKKPVIYTSVDFHRDVLQGELTEYPLWVRSVKYYPTVKYGDRHWHFWQHTATGTVPGIRGNVDRNCYYGTNDEWASFLNQSGPG